MTTLNDLPEEIVAHILRYVPQEEYDQIVTTCSQMYEVLDSIVGLPLRIGKQSDFDREIPEEAFVEDSFGKISQYGISSCVIGQLFDIEEDLPDFKYPHLLRKLVFRGLIFPSYFAHILISSPNVRILQIHVACFHYLDMNLFSMSSLWIHLEEIKITNKRYDNLCHRMYISMGPNARVKLPEDLEVTLCNLFKFLQTSHFGKLKKFTFHVPLVVNSLKRNLQTQIHLANFIQRHGETLNSLDIDILTIFQGENTIVETFDKNILLDEAARWKSHSMPNLSQISLKSEFPGKTFLLDEWWQLFQQESLVSLEMLVCGRESALPMPLWLKANSTLKIFHWHVKTSNNSDDPGITTLQPLEQCFVLHDLLIQGDHARNSLPAIQEISHFKVLPKSLRILRFHWVGLNNDCVKWCLTKLKGLEQAHFKGIGMAGDMGLTIDTLKFVFKKQKLEKLRVSMGINTASVTQALVRPKYTEGGFSFVIRLLQSEFKHSRFNRTEFSFGIQLAEKKTCKCHCKEYKYFSG